MSKSDYSHEVVDEASYDFYKKNSFVEHYDFGPSLTRQEFAEDCDINTIMARYEVTGQLPMNAAEARYMDLTGGPTDLLTAMNMLADAEASFMRLPAAVRREFDNDPVKFVDFASDPENLSQMRTWGLAPPEKVVEPVEAAKPPVSAGAAEAAPAASKAP